MFDENKTRFKRTEQALRFYFRLRELLHRGRSTRLLAHELPAAACPEASNAIDDYQCIGWSMLGLGELDLWLLSEVYGPTCFGVHRRTFAYVCKAGQLEFPDRTFRLREVGAQHRRALETVQRRLLALGMIPEAESHPARKRVHGNGNGHGASAHYQRRADYSAR